MTAIKRIRIITGPVDVVEAQLETLLDEYVPMPNGWHFTPIGETMHGTVTLIHIAELRKANIANPNLVRVK